MLFALPYIASVVVRPSSWDSIWLARAIPALSSPALPVQYFARDRQNESLLYLQLQFANIAAFNAE